MMLHKLHPLPNVHTNCKLSTPYGSEIESAQDFESRDPYGKVKGQIKATS